MILDRLFDQVHNRLVRLWVHQLDLNYLHIRVCVADVLDRLVDGAVASRELEDPVTGYKLDAAHDRVDPDGRVLDQDELVDVAVDVLGDLAADLGERVLELAADPSVYIRLMREIFGQFRAPFER